MAAVTGTYTRYTAQGLREQLSDIIYNISPDDTPVLSGASKERVNQTLFEWQTDALRPASTTNAHIDGDDITSFPSVTPTVRVGNYTQISRDLLIVSGTLDAVNKAGRKNELSYQLALKGRALKTDMEATILSNQGGDAGGASTPRVTATLGAWVKTNVDFNTGDGANPVYTSGVPSAGRTDGTQRAFSETILKNVVQECYISGATPSTLMVGPVNKAKVSGFTGVVTRNYDISNKAPKPTAVIAAVDVYVHDFGVLRVVPNRFQRERDAWFLDYNYLAVGTLRPFVTEKLAKTGDAEKRMLLVEWGLKVKQEAGLGLAADLTTA